MERIPILFLTDVLYTSRGGAEGVLRKMVTHLPAERFECSIATFATHAERVAASEYPCRVHLFPIRRTYDWNALRMGWRLAGLIRSQRIRILHTFFPASDLMGAAVGRLSRCPIVISSRRDMGFQRTALQRMIYRAAGGWLFDQVQAVAHGVRRHHIAEDRLAPEKVVTVYNGVDLDEVDAAANGRDLLPEELKNGPVIVCVANIRPVKAIDALVRTAAVVCREVPAARFLVIGAVQDDGYMRQVTELARARGISRKVFFAGSRGEVLPILKACAVFYMPSQSEGLSNAILEAMACGQPCVATDVGGNPELIQDGRNGYLVPVGDCDEAARRILELLHDSTAAQRMGRAGREIVEARFSVQAMIDNLTGLYEQLLDRQADGVRSKGAARPICVE